MKNTQGHHAGGQSQPGGKLAASLSPMPTGVKVQPVAQQKLEKPKNRKRHKQHMHVTAPHQKMSPEGHTELIIGVSRF